MERIDFQLNAEFVELNQLLKLVGICSSGGAGKMLVANGEVKVDGAIETRKTCKIRAGQIVRYGDSEISVTSVK
jgi:ribosome-associated protein